MNQTANPASGGRIIHAMRHRIRCTFSELSFRGRRREMISERARSVATMYERV
jgi:hypothetical protein